MHILTSDYRQAIFEPEKMKFHNNAKEGLYRFIYRLMEERAFPEVCNCVLALKDHSDYRNYFDNFVKSIQPILPETNREIRMKYSDIRSNLAIIAGLYYGDTLSLKHIERDYPEEIAKYSLDRESLKKEVMTFTRHLLFGKEASGVEKVGDLQIEQEGLVPMMNRIMVEVEGDEVQKHELMKHFRAYQILSENSLKEASEAAKNDPNLILFRNTLANRNSTTSLVSIGSEVADSKESEETRKTSFVERFASDKKSSEAKKTVSFSPDV